MKESWTLAGMLGNGDYNGKDEKKPKKDKHKNKRKDERRVDRNIEKFNKKFDKERTARVSKDRNKRDNNRRDERNFDSFDKGEKVKFSAIIEDGNSGIFEATKIYENGRKETVYILKDKDYEIPFELFSGRKFDGSKEKKRDGIDKIEYYEVKMPRRLFVTIAKHMRDTASPSED